VSKQISAIQTFAAADSKEAVLSLTLSDGSKIQYLVKSPEPRNVNATREEEPLRESVQKWQLASLGSALNVGDAGVPLGIALRISN
jgi:hypothetical protein